MVLDDEIIVLKKDQDAHEGVTYEIVQQIDRKRIMFPKDWEPERYFFHVDGD